MLHLTDVEKQYCIHDVKEYEMTYLLELPVLHVVTMWLNGEITDQQYEDYKEIINA